MPEPQTRHDRHDGPAWTALRRMQVAIGQRLLAERKRRHLTQRQVSELTGVAQTHIGAIERGSYHSNFLVMAARIAYGMGLEIEMRVVSPQEDKELPGSEGE